MGTTTMVHVRIKGDVKRKAERALDQMGISISDAVRILLVRIAVEKALPFALEVPNATTRKAIREARLGKGKRYENAEALFDKLR